MVRYVERQSKTILNTYRFIDSWFWCRYSINPYNGCEFACNYCDSRSHKYHLHPGFDQTVYVKSNVGPMLDARLTRARTLLPDVVAIGGTCDAYQPAEEKYRNTRTCLEVLLKHGYPVIMSTKSTLAPRDLDLFARIADASWLTIAATITTFDENLSHFLEPRAAPPADRLDMIKEVKESCPQIQAGVNFMPIVPFLCDNEANLREVTSRAKEAGADFILFGGGMTMRDNQAMWFLKRLKMEYPHLVAEYEKLYDATCSEETGYKGRYGPRPDYVSRISRMMLDLCDEHGLEFRVRRYLPDDFRRLNYKIAQKLLDEAYVCQALGKPWKELFWAGQNINNLRESIAETCRRGQLCSIGNLSPSLESALLEMLGREG